MELILGDPGDKNLHYPPFPIKIALETREGRTLYATPNWKSNSDEEIKSTPELHELMTFIKSRVKEMIVIRQGDNPNEAIPLNKHFNFKEMSKKIFIQCIYTRIHILNNLKKENWYQDTANYIDYNCHSFGFPSTGQNEYLDSMIHMLELMPRQEKLHYILDWIRNKRESLQQPETARVSSLLVLFDQWWNSIPFEVPYLKQLEKSHDELRSIQIFQTPSPEDQPNPYSGFMIYKLFTNDQMVESLNVLTERVMKSLNVLTLHDNKRLTEHDKISLGLAIAHRRKQLKRKYSVYDKSIQPKYEELWMEWLEDEKAFFSEIKPLTKSTIEANSTGPNKSFLTFNIESPLQLDELKTELSKFVDDPVRLSTLLDGKPVEGQILILDSCTQNKFCEIFKRLSYNNRIDQQSAEIINWLITYFKKNKGPLGLRSVEDLFQPAAKPVAKRIRNFSWLEYKDRDQLTKEAFNL